MSHISLNINFFAIKMSSYRKGSRRITKITISKINNIKKFFLPSQSTVLLNEFKGDVWRAREIEGDTVECSTVRILRLE